MKFLFIFLLCFNAFALDFKEIAFGDLKKGEARVDLSESDFQVQVPSTSFKMKSNLLRNSVQWVRLDDTLLAPRARIFINIEGDAKNFHLRYRGQSILMQEIRKGSAYTQFYVSLFQPDDIEVFQDGKLVDSIKIVTLKKKRAKAHLIDYSCSKYKLKVEGLENEYMSLGCKEQIYGKFGEERYMLQVYFAFADFRLLDKSNPPYLINIINNSPSKILVMNKDGQNSEFKISANLPKRYHRFKLAMGLGPYSYISKDKEEKTKEGWSPSVMLYGKMDFNRSTSLKFFNAYIQNKSTFNNAGMYLANDIAKFMDNRFTINTLLGFQELYFKSASSDSKSHSLIFPQGIELTLSHPFELDNYQLMFGGFVSTISTVQYVNTWVRFGKRVFWELNYIDWRENENYIRTWGLSVGFPIGAYF